MAYNRGKEMTDRRLEGLEVVEICNAIAGPFAGRLLAENGADVTKIEPLRGADFRNRKMWYDPEDTDDFTYRFMAYNTGKKSVAVDLKNPESREVMLSILKDADVFLENLRAGAMGRLGFEWEDLKEHNPELVYCSITGYGEFGPYEQWPAYDPAVQAVTGWADQVGVGGNDEPMIHRVSAIDHATALYATNGILMALVERGLTGEGQRVDVAMYDVAVSFLGHYFAEYSASQANPDLDPVYDMHIIEPGGIFEVDDGHVTLVAMPEYWESFCTAIEREEFAHPEHRFGTNEKRLSNANELRAEMDQVLSERTAREWQNRFAEEAPRTICAPVRTIAELFEDPHARERGLVLDREQPQLGEYSIPKTALRFSGSEIDVGEPPAVGENTVETLRSHGYSEEEIEQLRSASIVK